MMTENLPLSLGSSVVGKEVMVKKSGMFAASMGLKLAVYGVSFVIRMVWESR